MTTQRFADVENLVVRNHAFNGAHTGALASLSQLISPQQRQRFVKVVFGGDLASFDQLLIVLDSAPDWSQAHRLIRQHFKRHHINPYLKDAAMFSNLIYKRYFPHDIYV